MHRWYHKYFPANLQEWKLYLAKTVPIVLGAIFFSLNSFVDNFMVGTIPNAVASLSYANFWTGIVGSFVIGIGVFGSVLSGQFYGAARYEELRQSLHYRTLLSLIIALSFALVAWIIPAPFLRVVSHGNDANESQTIAYLRIIAIAWVMLAFTSQSGNLLRELGFGKAAFATTLIVLVTNVGFNLIFVFVLKFGAVGTAYASVLARGVAFFVNPLICNKIDKNIQYWYLPFWKINRAIVLQYWKRFVGFLLYAFSINLVILRSSLWNYAYPTMGDRDFFITGGTVIGIVATITTVMTSGIMAINGNINFFIAKHVANDEVTIAAQNAKKVSTINVLVAIFLSLLTILFVLVLIRIPAFYQGVYENVVDKLKERDWSSTLIQQKAQGAVAYYQTHVLYAMIVVAVFNPLWLWGITELRIAGIGGHANITAIINCSTGVLQLLWLVLLVYAIMPHSSVMRDQFWLTYTIFFASDIIKMLLFKVAERKIPWAKNLNAEYENLKKR